MYNVSKVDVPTVVYHASNDWLADPKDVKLLLNNIPKLVHSSEISGWQHLDFIWALDAASQVYKSVITYLKQYSSTKKRES